MNATTTKNRRRNLNVINKLFTTEIKKAQIDTVLPLIDDETSRNNLYHYINNLYSLLDIVIKSFLDKEIKSLNYNDILKLITTSICSTNLPTDYQDIIIDVFDIVYKALQKAVYYLLTDVHNLLISNIEEIKGHHVLLEYFYRYPDRLENYLPILEKRDSRLATWVKQNV